MNDALTVLMWVLIAFLGTGWLIVMTTFIIALVRAVRGK